HSQLVTMLDARQKGDEDTVRKILSEYKEQRCRKRTKNISLPMKRPMEVERKGKRRKLLPTNKFENYRSIMPHASTDSNGRRFEERRENQLALRHNMPVTYLQETPSYPSLTTSRYILNRSNPEAMNQCHSTTPTDSDYLRQSEGNSGPSAMEETHIMELDTPSTSMEPWWGLGNQIQPQSLPDFRQNNQLSYPLIYDYVASTEEQLKQHQKQQQQKQNEEHHGLFNLDWSSDAQYRPQAMSSPNHTTSIGLFSNNLMLPTIPEVPQLDDDMLEIIHSQQEQENNEIQQQIPQKCRYHNRGCKKTITDMGDLIQHEMGCECQPMYCYNGCSWRGSLKQLSAHFHEVGIIIIKHTILLFFQVHSSEIVDNDESSHTFSLNEVRARQSIAFLREVNKKLYVVSVHCHGHLLYATIQSVRTGKSDRFLVKASLEVVGEDGRPHSWRGKVRPVYESLSTLWATEQCLVLDPATIGAFAGANIILHTKITTYPIDSKM
ncbi:hypothetical protein ANN_02751, partial [Periplaneta americana]